MVGTLYLLAGILAALLLVLLFVLIQRRKRNYAIPKIKNKKGVFVNENGIDVESGHLGSRDFFRGTGKEEFETVCMSEELREQTFGLRRKQVRLTELGEGTVYQSVFASGLIIGRKGMEQDGYPCLTIPDASISGRHCRIFMHGNTVYVEDMGSTNKTVLNGRTVISAQPVQNGDVLRLGRKEFRFEMW